MHTLQLCMWVNCSKSYSVTLHPYLAHFVQMQQVTLNPTISMGEPLPALGNNTTLGNMDGVIGYSYTGLGNGEVVVVFGGL